MVKELVIDSNWYNDKVDLKFIKKPKGYQINVLSQTEPSYLNYESNDKIKVNGSKYVLVNFDATSCGISTQLFVLGYKDNKKIIVDVVDLKYSKLIKVDTIDEIRLMIRIDGKGLIDINSITLKLYDNEYITNEFKSNNTEDKFLVLTNVYPSCTDLYRNGFVHRRVKLYQEEGLNFDVFSTKGKGGICKYEYDGVDVYEGDKKSLEEFLANSRYKKILIHFIDKDMYSAIQTTVPDTKLLIWIHGVETEKWYRRMFNITTEKDIKNAIDGLENNFRKLKFMNEIYSRTDDRIKFIFVSKWFKEEVAEIDAKAKVIEDNYDIVPNIVDSEVFNYIEKNEEQRFNILTIRPFASRKYANDLSVSAILELSKESFFNKLNISIYGQGKLFNETIEPLKRFNNVKINETFLTQEEIAKLHKENGIFLCPTRLDSQGVSMCEAMSSGLVPITCGVTAIPEFVDEQCGILGREENYNDLADGIKKIIADPNLFSKMSLNASKKMINMCSKNKVISREIELITE